VIRFANGLVLTFYDQATDKGQMARHPKPAL
jgi:hypothetical protein